MNILGLISFVVALGGLLVYAWFVREQTRAMNRQALVMQESEWIPEAFFNAKTEFITFRGKRPWFPEFRAIVDERATRWIETNFNPLDEENQNMGVEWITRIPEEIGEFLTEFEEDEHQGELHFKFESFTGEEYIIKYNIHFSVEDSEYEITHYSSMERELPWNIDLGDI